MKHPDIHHCPGTLAEGFETYSPTALKRVFSGRKVHHLLPLDSPVVNKETEDQFLSYRQYISISGVQEKYSVRLEKNKILFVGKGESGTHILKPIPSNVRKPKQMPANEHLTMQIARQIFNIETAENALMFFQNGEPAYITKRFDINSDGTKLAQEDFASLSGKSPQTHGSQFKYMGHYFALFEIMQQLLPGYKVEAPKLFKLLLFNYLFSNGDAHLKNFSILETPMGDYRLSPAYDLLNTRIHIEDSDFALEEGLLPASQRQGKMRKQFKVLALEAGINEKIYSNIVTLMTSHSEKIEKMINASFLKESSKRNYLQCYQGRLKQLMK